MMRFSQSSRNQFLLNPASAGVYDFMDVTLVGRWQWSGFGDEPRTGALTFSNVIGVKNRVLFNPSLRISQGVVKSPEVNTGTLKHAIGGQLITDTYGAFARTSVSGVYAIHLPLSRQCNLSFGTRVGLSNSTFNSSKAVVGNTADPHSIYAGGDLTYDKFVSSQGNNFNLDISAGLYAYSRRFYLGVAADNLSKDFVRFGTGTSNFDYQIHYTFTGGVKLQVSEKVQLVPNVVLKYMNPAPLSVEGSMLVDYDDWVWFGAGYRHNDAIIGMFGINISQRFKMGYSYDYTISKLNTMGTSGHELVLGLMIGRK